jgi:hypothetical protein
MTRSRRTATLVAAGGIFAAVGAAQAQTLSLEGVWGNANGCKYVKDGLYENDDMLVLKPEGVESYVIGCEWLQVLTARNGTQVVTGICGHEGEDYPTVETYIVEKDQTDPALVRIRQSTGDVWGEVRKCP